MDNLKLIKDVKESMPESIAAIGYGSGVFKQAGYGKDEIPDKDIILVVENFRDFLIEDIKENPNHFSEDFDRNVFKRNKDKTKYYNNIGCLKFYKDNIHYKVMIISKNALEYDLKTWKYFGMAGRLTKPIIYEDIPKKLNDLIENNRKNALITALLYNSSNIMEKEDLYETLSKLTYMYDFRTILPGEKKTKAKDIVNGAMKFYDEHYLTSELIERDKNKIINNHPVELISDLPENLRNYILKDIKASSLEDIIETDSIKIQKSINKYLLKTNLINSVRLAIASSSTLGAKETVKHGIQKFKKHLKH